MNDKFPDVHKPKENISCTLFKYGDSKHNINCKTQTQNVCNLTHSRLVWWQTEPPAVTHEQWIKGVQELS